MMAVDLSDNHLRFFHFITYFQILLYVLLNWVKMLFTYLI